MLHVTALTMRRDAIYPSIVVGPPPAEDVWLGKATERIFLPAIRATLPELVDYDLPFAGAFHNCCIVSIRKSFPGHARKVMHAIWGLGLLSLTKCVIVVDADVDVHDYAQVTWQVGANVDPARDILLSSGPLDQLDHAPSIQSLGGKIGIDATAKWSSEGYPRVWPEVARMTEDVQARVTRALGRARHPARCACARGAGSAAAAAARMVAPDAVSGTRCARGAHGRRARSHGLPGAAARAGAGGRRRPRAGHGAPHRGADRACPTPSARGSSRATPTRSRRRCSARMSSAISGRRRRRRGTRRRGARARAGRARTCLTDAHAGGPRPGLVELRASLVIGAGSPTFELLRRLADRLPVLPLPRYADRRLQPLAAGDIVSCLVAACDGRRGRPQLRARRAPTR